jgi:ABC-type metal ion transport system substrate-binding protein
LQIADFRLQILDFKRYDKKNTYLHDGAIDAHWMQAKQLDGLESSE